MMVADELVVLVSEVCDDVVLDNDGIVDAILVILSKIQYYFF